MPTRRLLLLSNSTNPGTPLLAHASTAIREILGGIKSAVFIPYAAVRFSYDNYAVRVRAVFADLGIAVQSLHDAASPHEAVANAEAVVTGGGNSFQLLRALQEKRLLEPVRARALEGMPYIGWSAGANLACPTIRTTNDMPIVEVTTFRALDLVPFQINPHYTDARLPGHGGESRDDRILEFVTVNPDVRVLGLREGSMLRVDADRMTLLGPESARLFSAERSPVDHPPGEPLDFLLR
ncbi:MAG: dipeptidase PepE [Gemmatimonadota bacterium]